MSLKVKEKRICNEGVCGEHHRGTKTKQALLVSNLEQ